MKPTLSLQIGHQLSMTPQLQHAIKLLQLSALDLQAEIETYIETNPLLERLEDTEQSDLAEMEAIFASHSISKPSQVSNIDNKQDSFQQKITEPTLKEHLLFQWHLSPITEAEQIIGETIIDAINDNGYLEISLEEIYFILKCQLTINLEDIHAVLLKIQKLDPIGVGARDLRENLLIQIKNLSSILPWRKQAIELISQYLPILGRRDYVTLKKRLQLSLNDLKQVIQLIQSLNPKPGTVIGNQHADYIIPDIFVLKRNKKWLVFLNPNNAPKIRINPEYSNCEFLKNHLQEAKWFLKSLETRNNTLLKVAESITNKQSDFLERGDIGMKPLILQDIADEVDMHESTISRITTQKFMHTPRGIYELKYFFSNHFEMDSGKNCSSRSIQALIKQLIENENKTKPLSDHVLSKLLVEQGITVARRTIAKYRESMSILPSNERKQIL